MRGTLWQEDNHGIGGAGLWSSAPTVNHDGYTEMHPPDWIVRVREPHSNARLTARRTAPASPAVTGPQITTDFSITPDFKPTSATGKLQVRTVERLVDQRFTNAASVVNVREQIAATQDQVDVHVVIQPTGTQQARFKGAWLVGWREVDTFDEVWVNDSTPLATTVSGDGEGWDWQAGNVFAGTLAHHSPLRQGLHQHYFLGARVPMTVDRLDTLFAMVFLDPDNPPDEVMLQWHTMDWLSRAYWGANLIGFGTDGTTQRHFMGPLPASGEWVRLAVPAQSVGINGAVDGMAFTVHGGRAIWDYAGVRRIHHISPR